MNDFCYTQQHLAAIAIAALLLLLLRLL